MKNYEEQTRKLYEEIEALQNEALEFYKDSTQEEKDNLNCDIGFTIASYSLDIDEIGDNLTDKDIAMCNKRYPYLNELLELKLKLLSLLKYKNDSNTAVQLKNNQFILKEVSLLILALTVISDSETEFDCITSRETENDDFFEDLYQCKRKIESKIEFLTIQLMSRDELLEYISNLKQNHKDEIEDLSVMLDKRDEYIEIQEEELVIFKSIDNWYNSEFKNMDNNAKKLHKLFSDDYNSTKKLYKETLEERQNNRIESIKKIIKGEL